jgi:hypothetical protein
MMHRARLVRLLEPTHASVVKLDPVDPALLEQFSAYFLRVSKAGECVFIDSPGVDFVMIRLIFPSIHKAKIRL